MTGEFDVVHEDVAKLGLLVGRAASAARLFAAQNYRSGPNELGEGLLGMLAAPLDRWQALAETNTARAADLAAACADELQRAAAHYEKTELANLKLADAHYPAATSPKLTPGEVIAHASTGDFGDWESASADPRDPNSKYSGPPAPTELDATEGWPTDLEEKVERLTGATSVATHVRALLRQIVGLDPFDLITTLVSGDWKLLMTQGMIFEDTAIAFTRIKENITRGCYAIQDTWEGNAASAAENWLMAYAKAAGAHAQFSRDAGWKIKNFARAAYHGFVALNIGVDALLDSVVDLLFLGPLKGNPLKGAGAVVAAYEAVADIADGLRSLAHLVQAAAEVVAGNGEVAASTWPAQPYDHPDPSL
ncbi:hypothetical protein GCM10023148_06280 [Actinokineospora soli]